MNKEVILITGAGGQIGSELVTALRKIYDSVIASDLRVIPDTHSGPAESLDVTDAKRLAEIIDKYRVTQIYHLAAILSATGEKNPLWAWNVNMSGLLNLLDIGAEKGIKKLFFPSTIAVFGQSTPKNSTPQFTITEPNTVYGISKMAGERWCAWYADKKGIDIRALRYPGLISYKTKAGGGTTDYAVDIFFEACEKKKYDCFLHKDTRLPMMYMPDAIRGTIELMEAPAEKIKIRSAYNFAGCSFTPQEITMEIRKHIPDFVTTYSPDFRQQIAETWPESIDDHQARDDWGWKPEFMLKDITTDMLHHISASLIHAEKDQ